MISIGRENHWLTPVLLCLALGMPGGVALADGSETLGPPSIPIASGTGIVADGTGMIDQPGLIELTVPNNATVKQVLLYWNGFGYNGQNDATITVGGMSVTGTLVGGPDLFYEPSGNPAIWWYSSTFRADITNLGLVSPGNNAVTVDDMNFNVMNNGKFANNGAGIIAIIEDDSGAAALDIRDGNDIAWIGWPDPRKTTVPQTFDFAAAPVDRSAKITMFFAAVAGPVSSGGPLRPSVIEVTVGGSTQEFNNQLGSFDGPEWDTLVIDVNIPAGATSLTVQALSEDRTGSGMNPASYVWLAAGLSIPTSASLGDRVWEDLNGNGLQDCSDDNNNEVLGDSGDSGPECGAGVDGVMVQLLAPVNGSCDGASSVLDTEVTSGGGFYEFEVAPGNYCVSFQKPAGFECTLDNVGSDNAVDSDGADNGAGSCPVGELISLDPGENDPTWDLGLVKPRLGDRVWEDLDGDGTQDCVDTNGNGIIGDAGDTGPECDSGVDGVLVNLIESSNELCGDGDDAQIGFAITANGGFYGFDGGDGVTTGNYCVQFDISTVPADFCNTTVGGVTYPLGSPLYTTRNQGGDATDSDADATTGLSESVTLASGNFVDLGTDAGIVCPGKIGDRVWLDENENGLQEAGDEGVSGATVELWSCGTDSQVGGGDDIFTGETRTTDSNGLYMFGAEPGVYDLPPGDYYVVFRDDSGGEFTLFDQGVDDAIDSDCARDTGATSCFTVGGSRSVDLSRDCGIVPPPQCDLLLDKSCRVEPLPPQPFEGDCKGKLQQFTVIWGGTDTISVGGVSNDSDGSITMGEEVTFFGPFESNDVYVDVFGSSSGFSQSVFHVSCSDEDFNDPTDCGKLAGDAKGKSGFINQWTLEGFIDAEGRVLDCTGDPSEGGFSDNCTYEPPSPPACKDPFDKVQVLTLEYTGAGCAASDNSQASDKAVCSETGSLSGEVSIMASGRENFDGDIYTVDPTGVSPGDRFSISFGGNDLKSTSFVKLSDGLNTETNELHTSCSQPLAVGDVFGSLRVVGMNGLEGGADVTYAYDVTNLGDPLTNVMIEDNPLGTIVSGLSLGTGDSERFEVMERIFGTKTNSAQASGTLASGDVCAPASAFDTVTVEAVTPPCSIGIKLDRVEDDKLKIKLTNNDTRNRTITMDTLTVSYPAARGIVEKVKLNGDAYKFNDSANPILGNPATFGPTDWTEADIGKRQINPGDTKTLEIETFGTSSKDGRFELTVDFGEGCLLQIIVENQQVVLP